MKSKLYAAIALLFVVVNFQNCSNSNFSSGDSQSLSKLESEGDAGLVLIDESEGVQDGDVLVNAGSGESEVLVRGRSGEKRPEVEVKGEQCERKFVCVVEGPGKSQKVAFLNNAILSKVGTPADICMSEKACNEIIAQVMVVKGPEKRGFCPDKNPHVVNFSDQEVQNLVNKAKQK